MHRFIGIVAILLAVLALASPSLATGVCVAHGGLPAVAATGGEAPLSLPSPCEMQGGKRVLPDQPDFRRHMRAEDPRALATAWARGLMDEPMHEGRAPAMELPPPRLG